MASTCSVVLLAQITACASLALAQSSSPSAATVYLQNTSDGYQSTIDVYTDADAAGNHFAARGEIHSLNGPATPTMDEISSPAQCFDITCITAQFNAAGNNWGGWYFQNGVLGTTDRAPSLNWGTQPNAGYDLTGATNLEFWAKGMAGGEVVEFFAFGVGFDPTSGAQIAAYPDSSMKASTGPKTLSNSWTQYTIPLAGLDIHYVLGGFGWVASASSQTNTQQPITFYLDNIQYQKPRPTDSRFLVSYETIKSDNAFDAVLRNTAFVYDNAVALIALVAAGDLTRARTIADSFLYAQAHDRFFSDSRLRNAYQGGDISLPSGWLPNNKPDTVRMPGWYDAGRTTWFEDETQVSSNTGNIAWAMLALLSFYDSTREQKYLDAVDALGNWVINNTPDTRGNGGFTGGYDGWENGAAAGGTNTCASNVFVNGQCKRLYKATEHNIDLYAAFSRLYKIEGLSQWLQAAQQAKAFFLSMWDPVEGKFYTGTDEGGVNASTDVIPLDIQVWSLEALGADAGPYLQSLRYIEAHHKTALGYGFKQDGNNDCGDNTWFEGTSQVSLAYRLVGNTPKWNSILDDIHSAQLSSGAMPATEGSCLNTGFTLNDGQPWEYFPRAHVGATAWLSLAEQAVNPFGADQYAAGPRVQFSPTSVTFAGQDVGSTSNSSTVVFTNIGGAPLIISSVSVSGSKPQDFPSQSSSTCVAGATIPTGGTCSVDVAFSPTGSDSRSAVISMSDNSLGSPHTVSLSGDGMDFMLAVSSGGSSTQTVKKGATATYALTLSPLGGFNEVVSVTCAVTATNLTPLPECTISPAMPTIDGSNPTVINVTVTTASTTSSAIPFSGPAMLPGRGAFSTYAWTLILPTFLIFRRRRCKAHLRIVGSALALAMMAVLISCNSCSSSSGGGSGGANTSQPPVGTYNVTVIATHKSLVHKTPLTLTISN
jgi:hypothetical protein